MRYNSNISFKYIFGIQPFFSKYWLMSSENKHVSRIYALNFGIPILIHSSKIFQFSRLGCTQESYLQGVGELPVAQELLVGEAWCRAIGFPVRLAMTTRGGTDARSGLAN